MPAGSPDRPVAIADESKPIEYAILYKMLVMIGTNLPQLRHYGHWQGEYFF